MGCACSVSDCVSAEFQTNTPISPSSPPPKRCHFNPNTIEIPPHSPLMIPTGSNSDDGFDVAQKPITSTELCTLSVLRKYPQRTLTFRLRSTKGNAVLPATPTLGDDASQARSPCQPHPPPGPRSPGPLRAEFRSVHSLSQMNIVMDPAHEAIRGSPYGEVATALPRGTLCVVVASRAD